MGVYHFMGVGKSVGVVTCAVDYIENALDTIAEKTAMPTTLKLFHGSGGIKHEEVDKGKIEALVLFTSKEVIDGTLTAFPYAGCKKPGAVRKEIEKVLTRVWRRYPPEGRKIFWCELDIDDFQDCFNKLIKVTYRFSVSGKQGKEIWCNLTGGSNSVGFALLSMARLTGKSTKHYLISQRKDYRDEITVPASIQKISPDEDGYFHIVPFLKTDIDLSGFYEILLLLEAIKRPVTTQELFDRLRNKQLFLNISLDEFRRHQMLKLFGLGYTSYDSDADITEITGTGRLFINENLEPIIKIEDKLGQGTINLIEESKAWTWFTERTL